MLTLPIKKQWYDMILSGEKKEEYREIKSYYTIRFQNIGILGKDNILEKSQKEICFRNGYLSSSPSFVATCSLSIDTGNPNWGAVSNTKYYVLKIHGIKTSGI